MKFALKSIVAAAAFVAAGVASAANVTVPVNTPFGGLTFSGTGALSFSGELMGALDTGKVAVAAYGGAVATVTKDSDGFYTQASAAANISNLTIDTVSHNVVAAATVGGATQTAPVLKSVSSGGVMTVTDLRVDLTAKRVYANIISTNALNAAGDKTLNNFYLWDIMGTAQYDVEGTFTGYDASTAIVGTTLIGGPGTYVNTFNGLKITADGFTAFSKGLGLLTLGKSALLGVNDFGSITSTINAVAVPAIPEPSTYALMGLGLVGMSLVARRRAK